MTQYPVFFVTEPLIHPSRPAGRRHRSEGDSATFCVTSPEEVAEVSVIPLPTARRPVALVVAVDAFLDRFRDDPGTRATYTETMRRLRETAGDQLPMAELTAEIYRTLDWGGLAQFQLLDGRQYRDPPLIRGDEAERLDPARSMLGARQEAWLMDQLGASRAHWNVLAQQFMMGEARRPDPKTGAVKYSLDGWDGFPAARDRVLQRMVSAGNLSEREAARAALDPVPQTRRALPALAAHAADLALRNATPGTAPQLTIRKSVQRGLEAVARDAARKLGPKLSVALVLADSRTGDILGEVGSADYFDSRRSGWIDMTRVLRSPGSTLKPFIYGLAFEQGMIAQETMIEDSPADFGGYQPRNFDMGYQGDVTIRQALQLSLNVPAVRVLDAVGPARLIARFRQAGVNPTLPLNEAPGLAIGLGGVGITLRDLVQLYTGLANGGKVHALRDGTERIPVTDAAATILDAPANWQIADILGGMRPPQGAAPRGIAYKTGTSYGYRDAWSVGYDGRYVLGVWVGRADASAVPGLSGYVSAAPILFDGFVRSGLAAVPLPAQPAGVLRPRSEDLPVTLARFGPVGGPSVAGVSESAPRIVFPPDGARVDLAASTDQQSPLVLKLQGGRAPFRWLANGKPLVGLDRTRTATWQPDGAGYSTLTVIDAAGRAASVKVFVE